MGPNKHKSGLLVLFGFSTVHD